MRNNTRDYTSNPPQKQQKNTRERKQHEKTRTNMTTYIIKENHENKWPKEKKQQWIHITIRKQNQKSKYKTIQHKQQNTTRKQNKNENKIDTNRALHIKHPSSRQMEASKNRSYYTAIK